MRATGFFFSVPGQTYLITARHNVLPTKSSHLKSGEVGQRYNTTDYLPTIDVYLRTSSGLDVERIDIREVDGVKQSREIDVIGIPIDADPVAYGYKVWDAETVRLANNAQEALKIIGFDGKTFPDGDEDYDQDIYRNQTGLPVELPIVNELHNIPLDTDKYGLLGIAADEEFVGEGGDYKGLSGSPVIGEKLVGVHCLNAPLPGGALDQLGEDEFMLMTFWQARILPKMLA